MNTYKIITGDCIEGMRTLADNSVHCCVTSPPYWGLRDYGHDGQIGLESTPEAYVTRMVEVFREVRRVLRDDGTLWLNLGDSYTANGSGGSTAMTGGKTDPERGKKLGFGKIVRTMPQGLKPKDLVGIPWRVAFALQADGWWLRQDIIWHKPNPMPESVTDRCTKAHEYIFLLSKSPRYYYDAASIADTAVSADRPQPDPAQKTISPNATPWLDNRYAPGASGYGVGIDGKRNRRSVWTVTTKPYSGAHFAVMPAALVEPCIKAGCPEGGTVLDPFTGSGTTGAVALNLGRSFVGTELNSEYVKLAEERIANANPLFVNREVTP